MTKEKAEAVRAKIIEVCGELMELSFGCKIKLAHPKELERYPEQFNRPSNKGNTDWYDAWILTGIESSSRGDVYSYHFSVGNFGFSNSHLKPKIDKDVWDKMFSLGKIEILGHPITLAHVLRAIGKKNGYAIDVDGRFILGGEWISKDGIAITWDMLQDLDGQSDEVWDFLYSILINK